MGIHHGTNRRFVILSLVEGCQHRSRGGLHITHDAVYFFDRSSGFVFQSSSSSSSFFTTHCNQKDVTKLCLVYIDRLEMLLTFGGRDRILYGFGRDVTGCCGSSCGRIRTAWYSIILLNTTTTSLIRIRIICLHQHQFRGGFQDDLEFFHRLDPGIRRRRASSDVTPTTSPWWERRCQGRRDRGPVCGCAMSRGWRGRNSRSSSSSSSSI